jgi:hypothetical protein
LIKRIYTGKMCHSTDSDHLSLNTGTPLTYQHHEGGIIKYPLRTHARGTRSIYYDFIPYQCDIEFTREDFTPVDIHIEPWGLIIVGKLYTSNILETPREIPDTLQKAFHLLPTSLKNICGEVHFSCDNGQELINRLSANNNKLFGASDASFHDRTASHAWIISTGNIDDICDDDLCIHGHSPVDGHAEDMSSSRGELTGITSLSIMTRLFLNFHSSNATLEAICDNKGVINKCGSLSLNRLRTHREKHIDLYLTQKDISRTIPTKLLWVKGNSEKKP